MSVFAAYGAIHRHFLKVLSYYLFASHLRAHQALHTNPQQIFNVGKFDKSSFGCFLFFGPKNYFHKLRQFIFVLMVLFSTSLTAADFVTLVQSCEKCHGKDGNSTTPDVPIIAGFSYEGFLNTMDVFREDDRIAVEFHNPGEPETIMNDIAKALSDEDVRNLADYFSKRQFKPVQQSVNTELALRGEVIHKKSCEKCHSDNGAEPVDDAAILAGQWTPYLKRQFDNFLSGKRLIPRTMLRRIKKLSKQDIEALLNFYASEGMKIKTKSASN